MVIGVYMVLYNANISSVNVCISAIKIWVAEASTCTVTYFDETSVLYKFLALDIRGINDI
jgi:hypothetical protein